MRRIGLVAFATLMFSACLASELEGQPCAVDKDCWNTQQCTRTPQEEALDLDGLCLPKKTGCQEGQQLGCACDPADFEADCSTFAAPDRDGYPEMMCDMTMLVCVAVPTEEQMTMPAAEESST
jgi:hypothetical protein